MNDSDFQSIAQESSLKLNEISRSFLPKLKSLHTVEDDISERTQASQITRSITQKSGNHYVKIQLEPNRWAPVSIPKGLVTCGWLLSEVIRKLQQFKLSYDPQDVIGFKTNDIHLDYYLSCLHLELPNLDGMTLNPIIREPQDVVTIDSFQIIKKIGAGGFSVVYLVRKKDDGNFFAMKVIDKQLMLQRDREEIIFNERRILARLNNQRVITLYYAFQTRSKLFFVVEYCPGGELFYHLKNLKRFNEEQAKSIAKQVLNALHYLHSQKIIYRDLKPENILIDQDGFIKLGDFGLAKEVEQLDTLNNSFCGSLEYMAPEMLQEKGHDYTIDYYMFGVLLYELVAGIPPFYSRSKQDMIANIINKNIQYPQFFSKELKDLITKLCTKDRENRLGRKGTFEIYEHQWMKSAKVTSIKYSITEFNFHKMFINQQIDDINSGARCLGEEFNINQQQYDIDVSFENFSSFYFKRL
ncbi:hypothetical protein pb186bvf_006332 [Paramecium bursaria]